MTLAVTGEGEKSLYHHDCDRCTFLGVFEQCDLYHCHQGGLGPTVIARYSSQPSDYASGLHGADHHPLLSEALRRARTRRLIACETVN
jgi:hypothetical protein